ncbi:MAG: hypothetical protein AAFQ57_04235, partial [Cyanobacteria bacterium J06626_14]
PMNRCLNELLVNINQAFGTERVECIFRFFAGEQRTIGKIMISLLPSDEETIYGCIGYALFVKKMGGKEFSQ